MPDQPLIAIPDDAQEIVRMLHTEPARRSPHAFYDKLRDLAPVHRDQDSGAWYLARWEDCNRVLRSSRFGQGGRIKDDPRYAASSSLKLLGENLTGMDPPEHTRLRRFIMGGLSRPVVETVRRYLEQVTEDILDELAGKDEFDLVTDYAARIPNTVICEMLGVPRGDHAKFEAWIADQFRILSPLPVPDAVLAETDRSIDALEAYLGEILEERRRQPRDDLISAFVAAGAAGDAAGMTAREAVLTTNILLAGGSDTTKSVITFGTRALLQDPAQRARLGAYPPIDPVAMEELLRVSGPVLIANPRVSFDACEVGGAAIAAGDLVVPLLVAANFDPSVFPDPHRLDLTRTPNPHIAFGNGAHICVGMMLARMVAGHTIGALLRRFPELRLLEETFEPRLDLFALRGIKSLKVRKG